MMNRKPFVRLGLRKLARKNPAKRDDIRKILRDGDLLDAVCEETTAMAAMEYGIGDGDGLLGFLEWFIEHADEIFALISKLLILFAGEE